MVINFLQWINYHVCCSFFKKALLNPSIHNTWPLFKNTLVYWSTFYLFTFIFMYMGALSACMSIHLNTNSCEPPCECWEPNSGPSKEQWVLLTTEPSLVHPSVLLCLFIETRSLTWYSISWVSWPASPRNPPVLTSPCWDYRCTPLCLTFYWALGTDWALVLMLGQPALGNKVQFFLVWLLFSQVWWLELRHLEAKEDCELWDGHSGILSLRLAWAVVKVRRFSVRWSGKVVCVLSETVQLCCCGEGTVL